MPMAWDYDPERFDPEAAKFDLFVINSAGSITGAGDDLNTFLTSNQGRLIIPHVLNGTRVTSIGNNAINNRPLLYHLIIPGVLETIGIGAFQNNRNINTIIIGDGVDIIGIDAFSNIVELRNVVIGNGVTVIGRSAFQAPSNYNDQNLSSLIIGNSVISIGNNAFDRHRLSSLVIPDSVLTIGENAFRSANNGDRQVLASLHLGSRVLHIGDGAFELHRLTGLDIPASVRTIGNSAFRGDFKFTSLVIPDTVTSIGSSAFFSTISNVTDHVLNTIVIGSGITGIPISAFAGHRALKNIVMGENVRRIGQGAFRNSGLENLIIPAHIEVIEGAAFDQGDNAATQLLTRVTFMGSPNFSENGVLPRSVREVIFYTDHAVFTNSSITQPLPTPGNTLWSLYDSPDGGRGTYKLQTDPANPATMTWQKVGPPP